MKIFGRKIKKRELLENAMGLAIILAFVVDMMVPRVVSAQAVEPQAYLFAPLIDNAQITEAVQPMFPRSGEKKPVRTIWVIATAYSSDPAQTDDTPCIPASGYDLCAAYEANGVADTIAANFLPLHTQVSLPDLYTNQTFVVRDRMNKKYGYGRIDIWMPTYKEAKDFGVQRIQMNIY
ncbi:MAG TPA: hypothetical protein VJB37_00655 [Patescibacteria group bacterium]|uniref:3D domain-containing protein n=1 Tax=Candidatus Falkowbacteria bacterium RIFOXYC2_FULL_36_12 TaxID=1798002 RepID=A0A1F5T1N5_9BACT|nr:MAG: hypothetical protein A2478_01120 [Candidatus Falkowbacteria bacterium RIFOXYC2_FULL_36_12]HLD31394.1 hypothetical protein [Patescibacteria group bacterium]